MGASTSWLAVKGRSPEFILDTLGFQRHSEIDRYSSSVQGSHFPNGWYVIAAQGWSSRIVSDTALKRVSAGCEAVAGNTEEHVMISTAAGWQDGKRIWSVEHQSDIDIEDLNIEGQPPAALTAIHASALAQQAAGGRDCGVDYLFDVSLELCQALTGYRYDEPNPGEGDWHPLAAISKQSRLLRLIRRFAFPG